MMSNLDYKICKALKDAGFPIFLDNKGRMFKDHNGEQVYDPTLSELIEACGDGVFKMVRDKNGIWYAENLFKEGTGKTPEEAVANLYLALNKKDETNSPN